MRGKKQGAGIYWESHKWLLEVEKDGKKYKFCLKMGGKRCYFESVGYCLLNWHYKKLFEKLGELASILFGGLWVVIYWTK